MFRLRNNMHNEISIYEQLLLGVVFILGSLSGLLLQLSVDESRKPWRVVISSALLNGLFAMGVCGGVVYYAPDMPIFAVVGISAATSTLGRRVFLAVVEKWINRA